MILSQTIYVRYLLKIETEILPAFIPAHGEVHSDAADLHHFWWGPWGNACPTKQRAQNRTTNFNLSFFSKNGGSQRITQANRHRISTEDSTTRRMATIVLGAQCECDCATIRERG